MLVWVQDAPRLRMVSHNTVRGTPMTLLLGTQPPQGFLKEQVIPEHISLQRPRWPPWPRPPDQYEEERQQPFLPHEWQSARSAVRLRSRGPLDSFPPTRDRMHFRPSKRVWIRPFPRAARRQTFRARRLR